MSTRNKNIVMLILALSAAFAAWFMQPKAFLADVRPLMPLGEIVPTTFDEWQELQVPATQVVNPLVQEKLNTLYSQMLVRTYVNRKGERVMLSIAYGRDQRSDMAMHYPEYCYPAQGFSLASSKVEDLAINGSSFSVRRLETSLGKQRYEPVTYWTTIGDKRSLGGLQKRLTELQYGLNGQVPDGLLFRVSSIGKDSGQQFELQTHFIRTLLGSVSAERRLRLTGTTGA